MKHKVTIFRVSLLILSLPFGYVGVDQLQAGSWSTGMFYIAIAVGGLTYSNIIDPGKKTTLSDAVSGKTRWPLTPIGQILQLVYFILMAISGWLWLKYG
jgi:hypothetical protein